MAPTILDALSKHPPSSADDTDAVARAATTTSSTPGLLVARQTTDSAGSGSSDNEDSSPAMINYYFVFFALLLCIAGLCAYFVWRRRRKALMIYNNQAQAPYARDPREWDTARHRRRYWNTNFRNAPVSREEGLNENGEAPPPYMPKDDQETVNNGSQAAGQPMHGHTDGGPAIPLQTLSRDQAGLKPPDYEYSAQPSGSEANGSRPH
ncbi:hypothetical protein Q7P37_005760 [Cladosporium fusiforme]